MRKKTNDKKQKKPMPEYWYNGQPIKDDDALIEALVKDEKLEINKNITLYELHEDVCEACECAWEFDFGQAVDDTKCLVEELDEDEDLCGIKSIDYKEGESVTINGRKYTWSGALRKFVKLGVMKILTHKTVYHAYNDDYWYMEAAEPLEFLRDNNVYDYFEYHLESCPIDELKKWEKIYDI